MSCLDAAYQIACIFTSLNLVFLVGSGKIQQPPLVHSSFDTL